MGRPCYSGASECGYRRCRRCAKALASTRLAVPVLAKMLVTCLATVLELMTRASAIWGLLRPAARSRRTSSSREESLPRTGWDDGEDYSEVWGFLSTTSVVAGRVAIVPAASDHSPDGSSDKKRSIAPMIESL